MKTWKENNWFTRLDRIFEREKLLDLPSEYLTTDGKEHEKLSVDNLANFPDLMNLFFFDADLGESYDAMKHPDLRLRYLVGGIGYREDERGDCKRRAEVFKSFLIDTFIDSYVSRKLDPVEQSWQEKAKAENQAGQISRDKFFEIFLGISLEKFNQKVNEIRVRAEDQKLTKLSKDAKSVNHNTRAIIFDVRPGFIGINTTSNFFNQVYTKYSKIKDYVNFLRNKYQCSSFITGITATKGGRTNSGKVEDEYVIDKNLQQFQRDVYPLVKDRFRDLSEDWYRKLQKAAVACTYAPAFGDTPAIEALKVATATATWFKDQIGCNFEYKDNRFMIRTDKGVYHSLPDTAKLWNPLYRADAVYLIDSDTDFYSDGTPAKRYISVQIKSGTSHFAGSGAAHGLVLECLQSFGKKKNKQEQTKDPTLKKASITNNESAAVINVFRSLCRGGYIVTHNSWDEWFWLPDDYMNRPFSYGILDTSEAKDYYIRFKYVGHYYKLRVAKPDKKRLENTIRLEPDFTSDKREAL